VSRRQVDDALHTGFDSRPVPEYYAPMLRPHHAATRLTSICAGMCLLLSIPSAASQAKHHKHDLKMEVEGMEEEWREAQIAGDVGAMDKLLSDDYIGISMNGEVNNKAQQLDRLRTRSLVLTKIDTSDVKVKLLGRVAIVTSLATVAGTNQGVPLNGMYRYTRVYQRLPNGEWKITNFELTRVPAHGRFHQDPEDVAPRSGTEPNPGIR
jgi:ketosteroid isomerase-like protein